MSRFRIGAGLLVLLLVVCVWSQLRMSQIQKPIAAEVALAEDYAVREDWPAAAAAVSEAKAAWEENHTFVASLADHQPMEDIEGLFARLHAYETEDRSEYAALCAEIARRIRAVAEAQELSLGSFF